MPNSSSARTAKCGNPQTEDGFTRLANELLGAIARSNLTKEEHSVLYFVLMKTYGWNKKEDWISTSQISAGTGISPEHCSRAVSGLVRKAVLVRRIERRRVTLGIQKHYKRWTCLRADLPAEKTRWRARTSSGPRSAGSTHQPELAGRNEYQPELAGKSQPESAGYKSTVTKEVDDVARVREPEVSSTVLSKLDVSLGPAGMNQDVLALARELVERHGEAHVLRAISETAIRLVPPSGFLSYMRSMLDSQAKLGYTWEAKKPAASRPVDEEAAFYKQHVLYRQLSDDLVSGGSFALRRIEMHAPRFGIDPAEFRVLDTDPPRGECERLIRRFVSQTLRTTSPVPPRA